MAVGSVSWRLRGITTALITVLLAVAKVHLNRGTQDDQWHGSGCLRVERAGAQAPGLARSLLKGMQM